MLRKLCQPLHNTKHQPIFDLCLLQQLANNIQEHTRLTEPRQFNHPRSFKKEKEKEAALIASGTLC
jgi:hypothetical protein